MKKERYFKSFKEFKEFYYSADDLEIRNCKNFKHLEFSPIENNIICYDNSVLIVEDGKLYVRYLSDIDEKIEGDILAYANLKGDVV